MYGEEYHRIEMAMMEIELANAPPNWTEEQRNEYRRAASDLYDLRIAFGEHSNKLYRQAQKTCSKGQRLPWGTPFKRRLFALAERLGVVDERGCPRKNFGFEDHHESTEFENLIFEVGKALIKEQPEFELIVTTPGRPPRARNKQLNPKPEPPALRQRRRRQKKRDKYSI